MRLMFAVFAVVMGMAPASAQDVDVETKAYLGRALNEHGFAQAEFEAATRAFPLFSVHVLGTFAERRCALNPPSDHLYEAASGEQMLKTTEGKKVFIVAGVVATLKYEDAAGEKRFCDNTRKLLEEAEKLAAKQ